MNFLAPAAFALAALIPVIIAMYLLRLRRTEQVVSSVYLWRRMVRDVEANAPWQRLRRNLLLILQLLTLGALILALARPFTWAEGRAGQAAILILDTSASMAATDVAPSRLEAAKAQALSWVDGLPEETRVTVIAAADGAQVLAASSQDLRQVRQAIQEARLGNPGAGSDLSAALELASAMASRQPDTEIVVYSDGRVTLPEYLAMRGPVRYMPMGISGDNQAIGVLSLRPAPGGRLSAFAQVINYGDAAARRRLSLYAGDIAERRLVNAYDLDIPPGEQRAVVVDDLPAETQVVEARLGGEDVLALDDRAWAVHQASDPAAVTLVTDGNLFLETGLSLFPNLEVTTVRPEDWEAGSAEERKDGTADGESNLPTVQSSHLTILDAYVPLTATLPAGNLLFIAPPHSSEVFSVTGRVEQPIPRPVSGATGGVGAAQGAGDPLLAHVNLAEVSVQEAARVSLPAWARPVIVGDTEDGAVPLLWAGELDGRRVALLAFDLRRSDLPLQVAFPLLLANLTAWLAPSGSGDLPDQVTPGTVVSFSLPPDVNAVRVAHPDGSQARLPVTGGQAVVVDTGQLGVYRIEWGEGDEAYFAVNLNMANESDLRPADNLALAGAEGANGPTSDQAEHAARREWWRILAFVALGLLVAEWAVYYRATIARLWSTVKPRRSVRRQPET